MLLILDINGLLCCKVQPDCTEADLRPNKHYSVILRPGYAEFLQQCYAHYEVGFFSSTTEPNASAILKALLTKEQFKQTKFIWYRDRTSLDPDWQADQIHYDETWNDLEFNQEIKAHDTIKLLNNVWNNPMINAKRKYNSKNTLICDDSAMKLRYNSQQNCLIVSEYVYTSDENTTLKEIWNDIVERMQQL